MRANKTVLACLLSLASVAFLGKSYETALRGIDSNIHASVSMNVTSGQGVLPRLPIPIKNFHAAGTPVEGTGIDPNRTFNDHPFFIFWLNGLIMRALGPSATSARLLTGLFSVGSVWLTYLIGLALETQVFGVLAALALIFCRDFILTSATVSLDTALVFFILLSFYFWIRKHWIAMGVAAGVGLWVKSPVVLLVFAVAAILDLGSFTLLLGIGVLAVSVGSLIWVYTGLSGGWGLVEDYWVRQLWGTAVGGRGEQAQSWDWGRFFFYNLRTGFLPGLPWLVVALGRITLKRTWSKPSVSISVCAVLILGIVVTAIKFKLGHYFTPIFPFLALLSAHALSDWIGDATHPRREERFYQGITFATPLLLALFLIWPISFGPEAFVAFRRFIPLIQSQGNCKDVIALVPGGEPVGSELDSSLLLTFYTGRTVESVECSRVSGRVLSKARPAWIILSDSNLHQCVTDEALGQYPTRWRVGTQVLLSRAATPDAQISDLTALELPLEAVTDCQAPPYPQDVWHHYLKNP